MPYKSLTLEQAREQVAAGELNPESIMGMEGWPGDAKLEIFVPPKPAPVANTPSKPAKANQEKGTAPAAEPTAAPTEPAAAPGN